MGRTTDHSLDAALGVVPDAMVCVDGDGQIVAANELADRLFGYRGGELAGEPMEKLVPGVIRGAQIPHPAADPDAPGPRPMGRRMTITARRRDGSTFPADVALSAVDAREGIVTIAVIRDISCQLDDAERKLVESAAEGSRQERQRYQAELLESLSRLASGVAHDFNDILGAISGYASFIHEEVAGEAAQIRWDSVRADIREVESAAQRATVLTRQLLAFSQEQIARPMALDINELVSGMKGLLAQTLGEPVELVTVLGQDLGTVHADPGQIEHVLLNLAVNAREAISWGGKVTIETASVHVDDARAADEDGAVDEARAADEDGLSPGDFVCLTVSDTGKGIPGAILDRVFEPFFTTKAEGEGPGLGLATVYGIVKQAGGCTRISSQPGNGTTVTVLLPVAESGTEPAGAAPQKSEGGSGETVLLVEDDAVMREIVRRMLGEHGYRVLTAAGGEQAVVIATTQDRIDLLLTDVEMPQMRGTDVAERIRAIFPGVDVLFMSGYSGGLLGARGILDPKFDFIEKPFPRPVLLRKLREILAARA
jgi:PAS domain S-box-containing protein